MSVITSYSMTSETDIVNKLESAGVLTKGNSFDVPKYKFDENGVGHKDGTECYYHANLDLSKLWPEDWVEYSAQIFEHGVVNVDENILDRMDDYSVNDYLRTQMERPIVPEDRTFSSYAKLNGIWGYYTRNKAQTPDSIEFVPFEEDELAAIINGAKILAEMWKLTEGEYGIFARREYTEYEKDKMAVYPVHVSENGKKISYQRNYAHGRDDAVPSYIAHFLSDDKIHLTICTECMCDYDGYSENGKYGPNLAPSRKEQEEAIYGAES